MGEPQPKRAKTTAPLAVTQVGPTLRRLIADVEVVDLHTHLLPPCFGSMNLWGVDEMLTYHYLTCEFFQTATHLKPDDFFALPKDQQGDTIWEALFVQRSPVSEQCRGVISTLTLLGLVQSLHQLAALYGACTDCPKPLFRYIIRGTLSTSVTSSPFVRGSLRGPRSPLSTQ